MKKVLVKITNPASNDHKPLYVRVPEEDRELIYKDAVRKMNWLCMNCTAFRHGASLYAFVKPECTAHGHVIPEEVTA